jgi:Fic family protein
MDGNGRVARLIEKWFLAEKLGEKFWKLPSEKNYLDNRQEYYDSIDMGVNFYELDYSRCQHFLYMLPEALTSG